MPDDITDAIKIALASRGVTISDEDAEAIRSAVEAVWGPPPKVEGIFSLRDTSAALRLVRWALDVNFQEVLHSARAGNADVAKPQ